MDVLVLQHIACEPPGVYEDVLRERGATLHRVEVDAGEELPDWREFSAIVAMGGPMSANDDAELPWLREEKAFIAAAVRASMPFWGVCLGVQLLAASLGARVYAGAEPEVGVLPVELTEEGRRDPVFAALPPSLPALQWHGDTFDLPAGAVRLAGSPAYPEPGVPVRPRVRRPVPPRGVERRWRASGWTCRSTRTRSSRRSAAATLLRAVDESAAEMLEHGRALFERWLDFVVRTSSFNAVRLEA